MNVSHSPVIANFSGLIALLLWSSTALFLSYCSAVPPLLLTALSFFIGFLTFLFVWFVQKENITDTFKFPLPIVLLAVIGVGGYRLLYFSSMHFVPAVEASLINYLWPALIVVFCHFLPNEKMQWFHVVGAITGFVGVVVLLSPDMSILIQFSFGHLLALLAAITWALYSVASRMTKKYSSKVVPVSFLISGTIFLCLSSLTEKWETSLSGSDILPILFLGMASSVGYFLWDIGMKHGNMKFLSIGSFFVPLISTGLLILFGQADLENHIITAAMLIFLSAVIASKDKIMSNKQDNSKTKPR